MPSFCSHHNSVPLEQESIYGSQLASGHDDKDVLHNFWGETVIHDIEDRNKNTAKWLLMLS